MERRIGIEELAFINTCLQNAMRVDLLDVRLEVADHIACDMESYWIESPNLDFYDAYKMALSNIGEGRGIERMIEKRKSSIRKKYLLEFSKLIKDSFTYPKFLFSIVILISLYFIEPNIYSGSMTTFLNVILLLDLFLTMLLHFQMFSNNKSTKDTTLISILQFRNSMAFYIPILMLSLFWDASRLPNYQIVDPVCTYLMMLVAYFRWFVLHPYIKNEVASYENIVIG